MVYRGLMIFDTSVLPDNSLISSANLAATFYTENRSEDLSNLINHYLTIVSVDESVQNLPFSVVDYSRHSKFTEDEIITIESRLIPYEWAHFSPHVFALDDAGLEYMHNDEETIFGFRTGSDVEFNF